MTPARVARSLHISEHTVRSHLKQIFRKTNTHRQAELMSLRERADY
ncbi:LuxR family transcriptional regulator [Bordetella pertussis]|nr:LuxR family transcriptional regulator [Bordetella pertussis]